jgi:hypothetical protein
MGIEKEKKYFNAQDSILNSDDAPFAVSPNSWVNMENVRTGSTDKGTTGTVESVGGTLLLSTPQPSVNFITIGAASDEENGYHVYFKFNTTGRQDKIVAYYAASNIEYDVLLASQVTGGLNFSKNSIIHSARIANGYLYWPDGTNNQPRKINIEAAIKANNPSFITDQVAYTFPLNFSEITLIKPPPALAPNISKNFDSTFDNNFINNDSFEFAFEYIYYDNEVTVVGTYSPSSRLNFTTDNFNRIIVSMDSFERIPNTVRIINLVARVGDGTEGGGNIANIVKVWDKDVVSEAAEIVAQNNGSQVLTFNYYGNITGEALSKDDVLRPFDKVPIYSKALEVAKNRLFLGNNTEGYDTPTTTSLQISLGSQITLSATTQSTNLILVAYETQDGATVDFGYVGWYVNLPWATPSGYYAITSTENSYTAPVPVPMPTPAKPTTVAFTTGLAFRGTNWSQIVANTRPSGSTSPIITSPQSPQPYTDVITITGISATNYNVMTQKAPFFAGMAFYDFGLRKCGVITNDGITVATPTRNYAYSTAISGLNWTLSNNNVLNEIPDWAYYYAPVFTLNQRTRFFIQSSTIVAKYATRDNAGKYVFTSNIYLPNVVGIGLDTAALIQSGLGYVFNQGDICILIDSLNNIYELPVVGQDGNYIIIKAENIGNLSGVGFVFEVYTPYQTSTSETYFEMGELYNVLNPATSARQYSVIAGTIAADSYALSRSYNNTTYFAGAMSPNDLFYKRWDNDGGKVNFVTKLGQADKTQYITWSDTFIPNTGINGLSTFRVFNEIAVPQDCGSISSLILTSKVQSEGTVMLSICTVQTNSMYLQETQITDSTGATQFFSTSDKVISTINTLKGDFGTINPESVIAFRGNVYFYSAITGRVVQYSINGLFPISSYKMARFWNLFSLQYMSMTDDQIEALGSRPFIFATVDPNHNELLFTVPRVLQDPPKGYLPDYPNAVYPFDIYDGQSKTIVYKLDIVGDGRPKWLGSYSFSAEYFITLQNKLYSFKYGHLYLHNQTNNYNEFYGIQYSSKIMIVSNQMPSNPKVYNAVASESNLKPSFVYFYNDYPYQQSSDLVDNDFTDNGQRPMGLEGVWYCTIRRNKLIPTADGYTTDGLLTGEKMRNTAMFILFEWRVTTIPLELKFLNIGYTTGLGQPV